MAQLNTNNRRKLNVGRATKSLNTIKIKKKRQKWKYCSNTMEKNPHKGDEEESEGEWKRTKAIEWKKNEREEWI